MNVIFAKMLYELEKRQDMVLVTIISQEGSSPRGLGAQMIVGEQGRILGTIGGGAVERYAEQHALECLKNRTSEEKFYCLRQNGSDSIGMVCGGDVWIWFQFVDASNPEWRELAENLMERIKKHQSGWLVLHLDGSVPVLLEDGSTQTPLGEKCISGSCEQNGELSRQKCTRTEMCFYMPLPIRERALVFGGGHCAQALVPLLTTVGFRVTVMDDRAEYAVEEHFPDAEAVICGEYLKLSDYLTIMPSDYVVIMTNGHSHDLDVQKQVLKNPPAYVGAIGSKSKKAFVNAKLREAGFSDEVIGMVHSPIGTAIKAVTPEEIAVSIAGEMIYERALLRETCGVEFHGCPMHENGF